jgi:acid phosphatase
MVVVVMEENHGYADVIGNSAMPYLNSLAQQGALATQYYADVHPSIGNYLELTTGAMATTDDNFPGVVTSDNLAREVIAAGKTWKTYADEIPSAGYLGGDSGNYLKHHNPFAFFSDVINDSSQAARIVPFTQFASDLSAGALPAFSFIVPSQVHDADTCPGTVNCNDTTVLNTADQWLQSNISPLLSNSRFQSNGLLLVLFDEADLSDTSHGGGHVALIAIGPKAKAGTQSSTFYQHENTLRTICNALSLTVCPGAGASAGAETDLVP